MVIMMLHVPVCCCYWHCLYGIWSRVYVAVGHAFVCLSHHSTPALLQQREAGLLLGAPLAADIDHQQQWRNAANASSVTFTADVEG